MYGCYLYAFFLFGCFAKLLVLAESESLASCSPWLVGIAQERFHRVESSCGAGHLSEPVVLLSMAFWQVFKQRVKETEQWS